MPAPLISLTRWPGPSTRPGYSPGVRLTPSGPLEVKRDGQVVTDLHITRLRQRLREGRRHPTLKDHVYHRAVRDPDARLGGQPARRGRRNRRTGRRRRRGPPRRLHTSPGRRPPRPGWSPAGSRTAVVNLLDPRSRPRTGDAPRRLSSCLRRHRRPHPAQPAETPTTATPATRRTRVCCSTAPYTTCASRRTTATGAPTASRSSPNWSPRTWSCGTTSSAVASRSTRSTVPPTPASTGITATCGSTPVSRWPDRVGPGGSTPGTPGARTTSRPPHRAADWSGSRRITPRTRGAPQVTVNRAIGLGITPAYTGSRPQWLDLPDAVGSPPRTRGAHFLTCCAKDQLARSSSPCPQDHGG